MINTPKLTGKFGGAECPVIYVVLIKYQQCVCVCLHLGPPPHRGPILTVRWQLSQIGVMFHFWDVTRRRVPTILSMSNIVWYNRNHLDCALWANRGGTVIVDMLYERGAQQLSGRLCEECELWNCDPQGRISRKQKHTTVVAYIHVAALSMPTELIFIRH